MRHRRCRNGGVSAMTKPDSANRRRPGRRVARLVVLVLVLTSAVSVGAVPASTNQTSLDAFAAERADLSTASAGPALRRQVRRLETEAKRLEAMVEIMERIARRYRAWKRCISLVPVSEYGDRDHTFGYRYDERTEPGSTPGLPSPATPTADGRTTCSSTSPSGLDAKAQPPSRARPRNPERLITPLRLNPPSPAPLPSRRQRSVSGCADSRGRRRTSRSERRRLLDMSEEFDEWESCLSWVPVTDTETRRDGTATCSTQPADRATGPRVGR